MLAYASRTISQAEKSYSVSEQKILAVVWAAEKLGAYLLSQKPFQLIIDQTSLCSSFKMKNRRVRLQDGYFIYDHTKRILYIAKGR